MNWEKPHVIKIYEALGALSDSRLQIVSKEEGLTEAQVLSSSKNKFYNVKYNGKNKIMSNDNGSFYVGYLGYPSITLLLFLGKLELNEKIVTMFSEIAWKDINVKNNNDFDLSCTEILDIFTGRGGSLDNLESYVNSVFSQLALLQLEHFGKKVEPPKGY